MKTPSSWKFVAKETVWTELAFVFLVGQENFVNSVTEGSGNHNGRGLNLRHGKMCLTRTQYGFYWVEKFWKGTLVLTCTLGAGYGKPDAIHRILLWVLQHISGLYDCTSTKYYEVIRHETLPVDMYACSMVFLSFTVSNCCINTSCHRPPSRPFCRV